ncbi:hypothetical protein CsSME_00053517 [Camellia sinensis var. sinensis]
MEGSQSDPGGETGLEEPMWQLGFGSGVESYPERPNEADCIYYLRTGFAGTVRGVGSIIPSIKPQVLLL